MSGGGPVRPSPFELWQQAGGNPEEYRRLMREHGHLVAGKPEPLPCGWPGERGGHRTQCCPMDTYGTDSAGDLRPACTCDEGCPCVCPGCDCGSWADGDDW